MAKLRELLDRPPRKGPALPGWIDRLASVGIVNRDPDVVRRQRFTNVVAYAAALNAISHLFINATYGLESLLLSHVYNAVFATLMLMTTQLHRFGENAAAHVFLTLVVIGNLCVVWMFGVVAGLHIYFTLAGVALFMLGVQHWKQFLFWFAAFSAALIVSLRLAPVFGLLAPNNYALQGTLASHAMINALVINALIIVYALVALRRAEFELEEQKERADALVRIVFPTTIAKRLLSGSERRIADRIDDLSILFADLVGFSSAAHQETPDGVIDYLDEFVRVFDELCEMHGVEKIKTIGDCYMAAGGLRGAGDAQAVAIGNLALDMMKAQEVMRPLAGRALKLRIGIHYGSVTAGIIGETRFTYDIWGDAVNVASRMESHGLAGKIQVSEQYRDVTREVFEFEVRGATAVKGLGEVQTYLLRGVK
jgi:adenylate cyclase